MKPAPPVTKKDDWRIGGLDGLAGTDGLDGLESLDGLEELDGLDGLEELDGLDGLGIVDFTPYEYIIGHRL
jgi:hypothetical protein